MLFSSLISRYKFFSYKMYFNYSIYMQIVSFSILVFYLFFFNSLWLHIKINHYKKLMKIMSSIFIFSICNNHFSCKIFSIKELRTKKLFFIYVKYFDNCHMKKTLLKIHKILCNKRYYCNELNKILIRLYLGTKSSFL